MKKSEKNKASDKEYITFEVLRNYLSRVDRLSICMKETGKYENFICIREVPERFNNLYVYGIGIVESEFFRDGEVGCKVFGDEENLIVLSCIEIMLLQKP